MKLNGRLARLERQARVHLARTSAADHVIVISWRDDWQNDWRGGEPAEVSADALDELLPAPAPAAEPPPPTDTAGTPAPPTGFRESALRQPKPYRRTRSR